MTIFIGSIKGLINHKEGFPQDTMGMTAIAVSVKHLILHHRFTKSQIAWACIHCPLFQNEISTWPVLAKELWIQCCWLYWEDNHYAQHSSIVFTVGTLEQGQISDTCCTCCCKYYCSPQTVCPTKQQPLKGVVYLSLCEMTSEVSGVHSLSAPSWLIIFKICISPN